MAREHEYDPKAGEDRKNASMNQVEENAGELWMTAASTAIRLVAEGQEFLTTDDVWLRLEEEPHERRAMGPAMRNAQRDGVIVLVDQWRLTARARAHRRPLRMWRSLVFRKA